MQTMNITGTQDSPDKSLDKGFPVNARSVREAEKVLSKILQPTPFTLNRNLSADFSANVFLKREDLQIVRSYKIRGAYNKMQSLSAGELSRGVVCASAGNHAQGVAFSCKTMGIKGLIYMPSTTPAQKIKQVKLFGEDFVEVILTGDTFDDANRSALEDCKKKGMHFIPPFDDWKIIEGQATVALEILEQSALPIDYLFVPVGGGGLGAGTILVFSELSPNTKIIGIEPQGAPSMTRSLEKGEVTELESIEKFVDGAAVKRVGNLTFEVFKAYAIPVQTVPEGKVCSTILKLYNEEAIVAEPAGALAISALDWFREEIKGKNVVCVLSGGNNDISRTEEITERSMLYEGLKHYFVVRFAQRAGALREFLEKVLGPNDDIVHFEYTKKSSREKGPAVVGLVLKDPADFKTLLLKMKEFNIAYEYINDNPDLLQFLG